MIRVGRCKYEGSNRIDPSYEGFKKILVMMSGHSKWGDLGPYNLKNKEGHILENIWQASKVYPHVPYSRQKYSRYDSTVIWEHPCETHIDEEGNITEEYKKWRKLLMANPYAVRYPVTFSHRRKCLYSLKELDGQKLGYIAARKQIYLSVYKELVVNEFKFHELKSMLDKGENLLIVEVDGPHQESMEYYTEKYNVDQDFITHDSVLATGSNLQILLDDPKHPFGHGYCLAAALLNLELE